MAATNRKIHTVIFDVGGTLVNADSVFHAFADHMDSSRREELFQFMRPIFLRTYRDETRPDFWTVKEIASYVVKRAASHFKLEDISHKVPELYSDYYLGHAALFDDVMPTLKKLKAKRLKLIIVSDADADVLEREINTFGLMPYFDDVIISSDVKAYKPSDKMVSYISSRINGPMEGVLFVGDTEVDILAARKMKAKSILIRRNGNYPHPADYQISDLNDIFGIISAINNE